MADIDVTVIIPLKDRESVAPRVVRAAEAIAEGIALFDDQAELKWEILAVDQRSGDNTLSALSVLHSQNAHLRTLQDVAPGRALRLARDAARGQVWLVIDRPIEPSNGSWGINQVRSCAHRAAIIPGEMLVVDRDLGLKALPRSGGLVSAQRAVQRYLRGRNLSAVWSPPNNRTVTHRAGLFVRGQLGRVGLGRFDRPGILAGLLDD